MSTTAAKQLAHIVIVDKCEYKSGGHFIYTLRLDLPDIFDAPQVSKWCIVSADSKSHTAKLQNVYDPNKHIIVDTTTGLLQSGANDEPSFSMPTRELWHTNGLLNRAGGNLPADIKYITRGEFEEKTIFSERYYVNGILHRDNGPSVINYNILAPGDEDSILFSHFYDHGVSRIQSVSF